LKPSALGLVFVLSAAPAGAARAADLAPVADPFAGPSGTDTETPGGQGERGGQGGKEMSGAQPAPPPQPPASAPASVPASWEPGASIQQLPEGAYPAASPDGGIFGKSLVIGKPTRGIWGGSLWLTFHGLQWPYMPTTGIGVSGSAWVDTGYEKIGAPSDGQRVDRKFWLQQGRAVLRLTPTYSSGAFFIQAQVELVGNKDQSAATPLATTDDLWVRLGQWNRWDLQVGRYESWEVYHLGMGPDLHTLERVGATDGQLGDPPAPYLVRSTLGSTDTRESGVGYVGLHLYPTGFLRFELLTLAGNDSTGMNTGFNALGERPAMILDLGMIKVNVAGEYIRRRGSENFIDPTTNAQMGSKNTIFQRGVGGGIQVIFDPRFEAGLNVSRGIQDATLRDDSGMSDKTQSFDLLSLGGFANARIADDWIVGAGGNFNRKTDTNYLPAPDGTMKNGYFDQIQGFVALQYAVARRLFIKAVGGYSRATFSPGGVIVDTVDTMWSGRVRFLYLF
jgi:hypothetical protein